MSLELLLASALLLALLNGFFVAAAAALVKLRGSRLEELARDGHHRARLARRQVENRDRYLAAAQLGGALASIGLGWVGALLAARLAATIPPGMEIAGLSREGLGLLLALLLFAGVTGLHVLFGQQAPRTVANQRPDRISLLVAYPLYLFDRLFALPIRLLNAIAAFLSRSVGLNPSSEAAFAHSEEDLQRILAASQQNGVLKDSELDLVQQVFAFADKRARDVMIPRVDMAYLSTTWPIERVMAVVNEQGYTRFPLCEGYPDQILGMVHVKDLLNLAGQENPDLRSIARELLLVPESKPIDQLLREFQVRKKQMAVVLDEFGGTAGLVTLEDVLEEIVGEIQDEFEEEPPSIQALGPDGYLVDGKAPLEELREQIDLEIRPNGVDTLGGFVLEALGAVPSPGDHLEAGGYRIEVREVEGQRVRRLQLTRISPEPTAPA